MDCLKMNFFSENKLPRISFGEEQIDQRLTSFNSRYTFSAKEKDIETNYSYFGARYYTSDLSIWLSVDPMSDKYPSLSPYVYCANNPVMLVDPNGMDIINGYETDVAIAKEKVGIAQSKLDAFGGNKKADGYKAAKTELKAAKRELNTAEENYSTVKGAIKDLAEHNSDLYNSLDNLQDDKGHEVDVYVRLNGSLSSQGRDGQTVENYKTISGFFYYIGPTISCINCIIMEIDPNSSVDLGQILSHEGGHGLYDVRNAMEYFKWQKDNNLDYPEYNGHSKDPLDPSGREAYKQEDIYKKNSSNIQNSK